MGLFGFSKASFPQTTVSNNTVALYQRLRPIGLRLNSLTVS